jgi:hypothetical protein
MLKKLIVALGVTTPVLLAGNVLAATLPNLTPGSQFRYVFVTSGTRDATATSLRSYSNFVNDAARAGSQTSGITGTWDVIGSTATINARNSTDTTGTGGVPIYRVDGVLVANNYGDLWDGTIANPINVTENGSPQDTTVWTGSSADGSAITFPLGNGSVTIGRSPDTNAFWIEDATLPNDIPLSFYAMSPIQEIPTAIPEPTTIIASLLVGAGLLPLKRRSQKTK